jgi:HD-GYP domain-containing protein (c-di-GMP phosphodiesterase class II)
VAQAANLDMTTDRPYRRALAAEDALLELCANAGAQFSPVVVEALMRVVERSVPPAPSSAHELAS